MIHIAICDDEMNDLMQSKELIESVLPSVLNNTPWSLDTFTSSKDMINSDKIYNMVFLDVEMDGLNGIKTAEALHRKSPATVIFVVTHHEDYMDEALDNHAFRFWTKPMNRVRLERSIQSAIKKINDSRKTITVISSKKSIQIPLKDIIYIYHNNRLSHVVTTENEIETYDTFKSIKEQLPDEYFIATHASCCVNLNYVVNYSKTDIVCEHDGKTYDPYIARRKYEAFNKRFREWSGDV